MMRKITLLFLMLIFSAGIYAQFSGGDGSSGSPWEIDNENDLIDLSQNSQYWGDYFIQTSDISFNADETTVDWNGDGNTGGDGFSPIGNSSTNFTGSYDGQGHMIDNLFIDRTYSDRVALFGFIDEGSVSNLGVTNVNISGGGYGCGALAGLASEGSNINNCYSSGSVNNFNNYAGGMDTGGLVGSTNSISEISNCYSKCSVYGEDENTGGLVGQNYGTIKNSYSTGNVTGSSYVGGFSGDNDGTINNSYSTGSVTGSSDVGGFSGDNSGFISNCFWDEETSNISTSAGGTGKSTSEMKDFVTFTDVSNTTGLSSAWDFVNDPNDDSGTNDYWDMDQEGTVNNSYPILSWQDGADDVLQKYSGGSGTSNDPYKIASIDDLIELSNTSGDWSKHFIQTADIAFNSDQTLVDWDGDGTADWDAEDQKGFSPIGNSNTDFTGFYDGQNYKINNLYIDRPNETNVGLFSIVSSYEVGIKNLAVTNVNITGSDNVGGIIGYITYYTWIKNCYSTGTVNGENSVGGFIGKNDSDDAVVKNNYSKCDVTGNDKVGGFVGYLENASLSNCYSTGDVTRKSGSSNTNFGAFCGEYLSDWSKVIIKRSYSTGSVFESTGTDWSSGDKGFVGGGTGETDFTYNFFDAGTSNQSTGEGAEAKTTTEMTSACIYLSSGYDFADITWIGSDDNWTISSDDNNGYPAFAFQNFSNNVSSSKCIPFVTTDQVKNITKSSAEIDGEVVSENNDDVIEYGICYNTTGQPVTTDNKIVTGSGAGTYTSSMTGLSQNTTYYVRAFATNSQGTNYGFEDSFKTPTFSSGDGTQSSPYTISSLTDLRFLCQHPERYWDKYYEQTADIDASQTQYWDDSDDNSDGDLFNDNEDATSTGNNEGFSPIGNSNTEFTGFYDGQNNNINNLYIDRSSSEMVAFIGNTNEASLSNVNITNADITAGSRSGVLAGYLDNSSDVSNCFTSGNITATHYSGGLIGQIRRRSNVSDSYTSVDMTGTYGIGGFSGTASRGTRVEHCYSTGNVVSTDGSSPYVGGFIGDAFSWNDTDLQTEIVNCYSKGNVTIKYATSGPIGSFIGENTGYSGDNGKTIVKNSYATGQVIYKTASNPTDKGFIGSDDGSGVFNDNFFDEDVNQQTSGVGATEKTTSEMKNQSTFSNWTFDASNWAISEGNSRPYLSWQDVAVDNDYPDVSVTSVDFPEGNIHNNSGASLTLTYGYIYEQDAPPSWETSTKKEVGTNVSVSDGADQTIAATTISSLTEGTSYYVRSYTTDGSTVWYGETVQFTTSTISSMSWDGSESSDWNTSGNWSGDVIPDNTHNVTIPSDVPNDPIISDGDEADCNDLTVESGATLTVNDGGSLITAGTITNNGTIDINMDATAGEWNLVAIPTTTETADVFYDNYLQKWNETTAGWEEITDENTSLTPVKGYSLWPPASKNSFTFSGTPNNGNQSIAISHTNNGSDNEGANLVGNPYPSYLDWDQVSGYGAKYSWDGTAYNAYTNVDGYGSGTRDVAPMEGFFIVTDSDGTFSLDNSMRSHKLSPSKSGEAKSLSNGLVLSASNGSYEDEFWLVFNDQASENFELQRDAWKLLSDTEGISQLYSFSPDGKMSIDVRPMTGEIQLGYQNNQPGTYTIGLKEIANLQKAVLEDTKEEVFHDLTEGNYEFAWKTIDSETRFKLHLSTVGIEDEINNESQDLLIYANKQNIYLKTKEDPGEMDVRVRDITGRTLLQKQVNGSGTITIPTSLQTGVYVVEVMQNQERTTEKVMIKE